MLILDSNGELWGWGDNGSRAVSGSAVNWVTSISKVFKQSQWPGLTVTGFAIGGNQYEATTAVILSDGNLRGVS